MSAVTQAVGCKTGLFYRAMFLGAAVLLVLVPFASPARSWRPGQIPNGGSLGCATCHFDPGGGGPRNFFGQAVEAELVRLYGSANGASGEFWGPVLAVLDSDRDFFTNGEELGDPGGAWVVGNPNPPGSVTHPGDASSHPTNAPPSVSVTSPVNGAVFTIPANVTIQAAAADSDGLVTGVEFWDGTTLLGNSSTSPYSFTAILSSLGNHRLTARATDNRGATTTSAPVTVTLQSPGTPPSISITSPSEGALFAAPANLLIQADATDLDGVVTNVAFFNGSDFLGSDTTAPYVVTALLSYGGTHRLTAIASDDAGWVVTSAPISVNVSGGRLWDVTILNLTFSPTNLTVQAGDTVRWTSTGNHSVVSGATGLYDGRFNSGLLANGQTFLWTFTNAGIYPYFCLAHGSQHLGGSQRGSIIVLPAAAPSVALTSPPDGAVFTTRELVTLSATASDPDGIVTKVEFLDSGSLLGTLTNEPYTLTIALSPGPHVLTARATDNENGKATSSPVTIQVNTVPILDPIPQRIPKGGLTIELRTVAQGLAAPLGSAAPDDGSGRMFVYDQAGLIHVLIATGLLGAPLLDLRSSLLSQNSYDERGLLGVAAHPDFAQFPLIYTYSSQSNAGPANFTTSATNHNHQSVIAEWRMDPADPNRAAPSSRREILRIDQPQSNHNGGTMRFGPDGYLYIALGDGGRSDDQGDGHEPEGNAQSLSNVHGKLLRVNVHGTDSLNGQYGIPPGNPFYGQGLVDEIFAYGLRNPFSFSFDRGTGQLLLGDVGQNRIEEVNIVVAGGNYGWRIKEGTFFFDPNGTNAGYVTDTPVVPVVPPVIDPIAQYDHDEGQAIIGGFVYRGTRFPALQGRYIFGDWGSFGAPSGRLFYLDATNGVRELRIGLDNRPLGYWLKGFGEDAEGELYVMASTTLGPQGSTGKVFKIVPPPDPVSITTVRVTGVTLEFSWTAVVGRLYQVQFKLHLDQAQWSDLGDPIAAASTVMSVSQLIGFDSQRFFRVVPLP